MTRHGYQDPAIADQASRKMVNVSMLSSEGMPVLFTKLHESAVTKSTLASPSGTGRQGCNNT